MLNVFQETSQEKDETATPSDIVSVEDLRSYVRAAIAALKDPKNYLTTYDGATGCVDLSDVATQALQEKGFGPYSAHWTTHAFHWLMFNQEGLVTYRQFNHPKKEGEDGQKIHGIFIPANGKFESRSIDELTDIFMKKHGEYVFARIQRIREHPEHRPY